MAPASGESLACTNYWYHQGTWAESGMSAAEVAEQIMPTRAGPIVRLSPVDQMATDRSGSVKVPRFLARAVILGSCSGADPEPLLRSR